MGLLILCCWVISKLDEISHAEFLVNHANHRAAPSLETNRKLILFWIRHMHCKRASCNIIFHSMGYTKAFWGEEFFTTHTCFLICWNKIMFLDHCLYHSENRKPEKCQWLRFLKNCHSKEGHSECLVLKQTPGLTSSDSSAVLQSIHGGFIGYAEANGSGRRSAAVDCMARL